MVSPPAFLGALLDRHARLAAERVLQGFSPARGHRHCYRLDSKAAGVATQRQAARPAAEWAMSPAVADDHVSSPFQDLPCPQLAHLGKEQASDCTPGSIPSDQQNGIQTPERSPDPQASLRPTTMCV